MSNKAKIIVLIMSGLLMGAAIINEVVFAPDVGLGALMRLAVVCGAVFLIAFFLISSPGTLTGRKPKSDKPAQPLFRIHHKGETIDEGAEKTGPRRLFQIIHKKDGAAARPGVGKNDKPARMFGTAGVRGFTNTEITPLLVLKMAQVYGDLLREINKNTALIVRQFEQSELLPTILGCNSVPSNSPSTVAIGYDSRYGSEMLAISAGGGLMSAGINTVNLGCIPTGGIAHYIVHKGLAGGVLITGSHMPYNMTGLIILKSDGSYLDDEIARELERRFAEYGARTQVVLPESVGKSEPGNMALEIYSDFLLARVDTGLIKSKGYRVLVDPANGPATLVLPDLLKRLGCEVFLTNERISAVPNRPAEPRANNLIETAAKVTENKCDLGIATDVDADRVLFIDATGRVLSEDLTGAIFARSILGANGLYSGSLSPPEADELLPGIVGCNRQASTAALCVTPINSSSLIDEVVVSCGARLCYCPIGQPATLKVVREKKADFSYEESGKYYFARDVLWPDGILASIKLLEIMARQQKPLAELAAEFPVFYQVKHTVPVPSKIKESLMDAITKIWQSRCQAGQSGCTETVTIDGLKTIYDDKAWLLIRKSGTEPLIRVYADAKSKERAEELVKLGEQIVQEAISQSKSL